MLTSEKRSDDRTDAELLHAFHRGDRFAFNALVERHGRALKGYALRMLRSAEAAEEVYEDTFLRLLQARREWVPRGTVRGYLFTIAHRLCLDRLRRRRTAQAALPHLRQIAEARRMAPSPEAQAELGQRAQAVEDAIQQLPESHREVLLLRVMHGLSAAETAQALELTESQVHSQLSYARKRLKQLLARTVAAGGSR